jgi:hypothetical protein
MGAIHSKFDVSLFVVRNPFCFQEAFGDLAP